MELATLSSLAGGIGLFLLGMHLMTQGLRQAAGQSLKDALNAATRSRLKGLLSGTLITALVQSSSAVTVATIGFVNAGLLSLAQSVAVIYGCNIGTTMTSWLVAMIGFKIKISAFALPLVALGMLFNLAAPKEKWRQLGFALAGFGVFFIGLDFLKVAFDGLESSIDLSGAQQHSLSLLIFLLAGFALTFLMQSSSASMAITLSLAATGAITMTSAAALVIGANLGTTSTAILAVIGATPNAKRIAAAHVTFNLITGIVGFALLLLFSDTINQLNQWIEVVTLLALFHTLFNVLGVAIMWRLTDPMVAFLQTRFRSSEETLGKPQYLDKNILATPSLAVEAMSLELGRVSRISSAMALASVSEEEPATAQLNHDFQAVSALVASVASFNQQIARQNLEPDISALLPASLRVAGYLGEVARLSVRLTDYQSVFDTISDQTLQRDLYQFKKQLTKLLEACTIADNQDTDSEPARQLLHTLEQDYQALKSAILDATSQGRLAPDESGPLLDGISHLRRLAEQAEKASTHWSSMLPVQTRQPLPAQAH